MDIAVGIGQVGSQAANLGCPDCVCAHSLIYTSNLVTSARFPSWSSRMFSRTRSHEMSTFGRMLLARTQRSMDRQKKPVKPLRGARASINRKVSTSRTCAGTARLERDKQQYNPEQGLNGVAVQGSDLRPPALVCRMLQGKQGHDTSHEIKPRAGRDAGLFPVVAAARGVSEWSPVGKLVCATSLTRLRPPSLSCQGPMREQGTNRLAPKKTDSA